MIKKSSNRYLHFIIIVIFTTISLIVLSVFYIVNTTFAIEEKSNYKKAFIWQEKNKGVVGVTINISAEYKQRMLEWRLSKKDVDTLILGSSTVMSIKEDMFKNHIVFNGATNSNPLYYTLPVAKYYSKYNDNIKNIIIAFDWALGLPYWNYQNIKYNPLIETKKSISFIDKIKDAISYQRVKIILTNIIFTNTISEYKCPTEDTMGTDQFFKTDRPKSCNGFRFDGSAIFPDQTRVSEKKWLNYLDNGLSKYQQQFDINLGNINIEYLNGFKEINQNLQSKGGQLIILMPPLIPKATTTMEDISKSLYVKKIAKLLNFAKENNIYILDASKSEEYGCTYGEFLDLHHSFSSCYKKILKTLPFLNTKEDK